MYAVLYFGAHRNFGFHIVERIILKLAKKNLLNKSN